MNSLLSKRRCTSQRFVIVFLCALTVIASDTFAQSGRKQLPIPPPNDSTEKTQSLKPDTEPPLNLAIVTNATDVSQVLGFSTGFAPLPTNLEYYARGGCLQELKNASGAKLPALKFIEDENVPRWEAREMARTDENWVVWMELKFESPTSASSITFKLRYLLLEPQTGKIIASGFGNPVRQIWGKPASRPAAVEDQAREAGRDVARQIISELQKRK
jgi:hypothetical protein